MATLAVTGRARIAELMPAATNMKTASAAGLALGYDLGAIGYIPIRLELEYLKRGGIKGHYDTKVTASNGSMFASSNHNVRASVSTVFANTYLDFHNDTKFTPYFGVDLGVAYIDAKTSGNRRDNLVHKTGHYVDELPNTNIKNYDYAYKGNMGQPAEQL